MSVSLYGPWRENRRGDSIDGLSIHRQRKLLKLRLSPSCPRSTSARPAATAAYCKVHPPSISKVAPVISAAAGEAKNTTGQATSLTSPTRPRGMRSITDWRNSGMSRSGWVPGVSMKVGATLLTVTLYCAHSAARHLVRWAMASQRAYAAYHNSELFPGAGNYMFCSAAWICIFNGPRSCSMTDQTISRSISK